MSISSAAAIRVSSPEPVATVPLSAAETRPVSVRATGPGTGASDITKPAAAGVRATYWTGWLSPEMEGCSKEVFALREHFHRSRVFGLSRYYIAKASRRRRYVGLNIRLYPLFRAMAPFLDATSDVNHIYGSLNEWFFLRAVWRRPLIMTIAITAAPFERTTYRHVRQFITHSDSTTATMVRLGFDPRRITVIYPGLDLTRFTPGSRASGLPFDGSRAPDAGRFRILFATTPNTRDGVRLRGVELMTEAARRLPDVDFYLLWRPWEGVDRICEECRAKAPSNVHISTGFVSDMNRMYQSADATVAPFLKRTDMKVCPTSLVESLACGRPVLVSNKVGIADLVRRERCGEVFSPSADGLCLAIGRLRDHYLEYSGNARRCAERHFDQMDCFRRHERLYREVIDRG